MSDPLRKLHHDIRGRLNALKLCLAALETPMETSEALEFLTDIENLCDHFVDLMNELERQTVAATP